MEEVGTLGDTCGKCWLLSQSLPRKLPLFIFVRLYKERILWIVYVGAVCQAAWAVHV